MARVPWSLVLVYNFTALPTDYGRKVGPPKPPHPIQICRDRVTIQRDKSADFL